MVCWALGMALIVGGALFALLIGNLVMLGVNLISINLDVETIDDGFFGNGLLGLILLLLLIAVVAGLSIGAYAIGHAVARCR